MKSEKNALSDPSGKVAFCRLTGISKSFGSVQAVQAVSLDIPAGEILAIVGENGAGKTTLMNLLFGLLQPDSGSVELEGQPRRFKSAREAIRAGLGMVHQHFMLFPDLTVLENILIGAEKSSALRFVDFAARRHEISAMLEQFGFSLSLDARVSSLPVHARQQVEISKMLFRKARLIILDEPTAVLTPDESDRLFTMLRRLRDDQRAVVIITHKLDEVMAVSDRVMIMRGGQKILETATKDTSKAAIAAAMIGHEIASPPKLDHRRDEMVLEVENLSVLRDDGSSVVDDVSLKIGAGEIFGIAGVSGNGQKQLVEALVGTLRAASGKIALSGQDIRRETVGFRRTLGLGYMAEDRMSVGLASDGQIWENTVAGQETSLRFSRGGWLKRRAARTHGADIIKAYDVVATGPSQRVGDLSGGNKQKIIVGRELSCEPTLIIAENPSWGVDIGAMAFIHTQLLAAAARGAGVLLVSSDLEELFELSDRVGVFYNGRLNGIFARDELDVYKVGAAMSGKIDELSEQEER
ncbi:MAG: ABC transporter ATP-binding protein, partial [Alphaproteobacteria bacterium]|nr:ABC transporter ATP-binding protein [Alphaproteobacteria bacterium]